MATGGQHLLLPTAAGMTLNQAQRRRKQPQTKCAKDMDFNAEQCHFYYSIEQHLPPESFSQDGL